MQLRLAYTPKFKQLVRENPGIIQKFANVYKNNLETYADSKVEIRKFNPGTEIGENGQMQKNGRTHHQLWAVDVGGKEFIVKETLKQENTVCLHMTGDRQYRLMHRLSAFLKHLSKFWKHDIEVLEPYAGASYWDTSFIVTEFIKCPRASESRVPYELRKQHRIMQHLAYFFKGIGDICETNAFYDAKRGKLILNDPNGGLHVFPIRAAFYFGRILRFAYRYAVCPEKTWFGQNASEKEAVLNPTNVSLPHGRVAQR